MKEIKEKNGIRNAGIVTLFLVTVVCGLVAMANLSDTVVIEKTTSWKGWSYHIGEATPTGSGFLEIYYINLSDSGYAYTNTSATLEGYCDTLWGDDKTGYADADEYDLELASETTFAILVRVRYNQTHCYETDHWNGARTDVQITVTCTSWAVGSDINNVSGTRYEAANVSGYTYLYEHFVWDNTGSGYQIADDATLTNSEIYIEAKY